MVELTKKQNKIDPIGIISNSFENLKKNGFKKPLLVNILAGFFTIFLIFIISFLPLIFMSLNPNSYNSFSNYVLFFVLVIMVVVPTQSFMTFLQFSFQYKYHRDNSINFKESYNKKLQLKGFLTMLKTFLLIFIWITPLILTTFLSVIMNSELLMVVLFFISFCLYITGIVKSVTYIIVPLVVVDNPEHSINEIIKKSQLIMKGNKFRLFISLFLVSLMVNMLVSMFSIPITFLMIPVAMIPVLGFFIVTLMTIAIYALGFGFMTFIYQIIIEAYEKIK